MTVESDFSVARAEYLKGLVSLFARSTEKQSRRRLYSLRERGCLAERGGHKGDHGDWQKNAHRVLEYSMGYATRSGVGLKAAAGGQQAAGSEGKQRAREVREYSSGTSGWTL